MYIILSRQQATDKTAAGRLVASPKPVVHTSYEEAKAEAQRLAAKEPSKEFLIFQTQIAYRAEVLPAYAFIPT